MIAGESTDSRVGVALLTEFVSEPLFVVGVVAATAALAVVVDFALFSAEALTNCDGSTDTRLFFEWRFS